MLVSAVQMDVRTRDLHANMDRAHRLVAEAVRRGSKLVLLPEMWNTGFTSKDFAELTRSAYEPTLRFLIDTAREGRAWLVGTVGEPVDAGVCNTMMWVSPSGEVAAKYRKSHLFRPTGEDERFVAGGYLGPVRTDCGVTGGLICFEIRFPEIARKLALDGAEILLVPAQFPEPRLAHWTTLLQARAIENQVWVVAANRVGASGPFSYFGHSMIIDPWGQVVEAEMSGTEAVISAEIDPALVAEVRSRLPCPRRPDLYGNLEPAM